MYFCSLAFACDSCFALQIIFIAALGRYESVHIHFGIDDVVLMPGYCLPGRLFTSRLFSGFFPLNVRRRFRNEINVM